MAATGEQSCLKLTSVSLAIDPHTVRLQRSDLQRQHPCNWSGCHLENMLAPRVAPGVESVTDIDIYHGVQ